MLGGVSNRSVKESVKKFFAGLGEAEWNRLVKDPYHRLELHTTLYFLNKYLPKEGRILDAGGGPGRYSIDLVNQDKRGLSVRLYVDNPN